MSHLCLNCGEPVEEEDARCPECGTPTATDAQMAKEVKGDFNSFNFEGKSLCFDNATGLAGLLLFLTSFLLLITPWLQGLSPVILPVLIVIAYIAGRICTAIGERKEHEVAHVARGLYVLAFFGIVVLLILHYSFEDWFNFAEYFGIR